MRAVLTAAHLWVSQPCFPNCSVARIKDSQVGFAYGSGKKSASIFVYFVVAVDLGFIVDVVRSHCYSPVKSSMLAYTYHKLKSILHYRIDERIKSIP